MAASLPRSGKGLQAGGFDSLRPPPGRSPLFHTVLNKAMRVVASISLFFLSAERKRLMERRIRGRSGSTWRLCGDDGPPRWPGFDPSSGTKGERKKRHLAPRSRFRRGLADSNPE